MACILFYPFRAPLLSPLLYSLLSCPLLSLHSSLLSFTLFCPLLHPLLFSPSPSLLFSPTPSLLFSPPLSSVPHYSAISYSAISSQFRYVLRYDMVCYIDPLKGRPREQPAFNIQ